MSTQAGALYIVATPIGNLDDLTSRARAVLAEVDCVAAEDTRRSGNLLRHLGLHTPLVALHEHNERRVCAELVARLAAGERIALISDAGTPLVSDPGYHLVCAAHEAGVTVVPVPGPSAVMAALSVAGLPTDRFVFEGFLPARAKARRERLEALVGELRTLVFFEAPHRLLECLEAMVQVFGEERLAVLARELTKSFETVLRLPLGALLERVRSDSDQRRGEAVLLLHGAPAGEGQGAAEAEAFRIAAILAETLSPSQAAALAARITGAKRNPIYRHLLGQEPE